MPNVASLPTDVASLQRLVLEQQHMIDMLKANLHLALHRQFGRRNESVDVDQIGLFAGAVDAATIIELDVAPAARNCARRVVFAYFANPASVCCFIETSAVKLDLASEWWVNQTFPNKALERTVMDKVLAERASRAASSPRMRQRAADQRQR